MELAVVRLLDYRRQIIVPNVSWGLGLSHECDLLCLTPSEYLVEYEIKISKSDFLRDFKKWHGHKSKIVSALVYVVPENLLDLAVSTLEPEIGVVVVGWVENKFYDDGGYYEASWVRRAKKRKFAEKAPKTTQWKLLQLGVMRIWDLKRKLFNSKK